MSANHESSYTDRLTLVADVDSESEEWGPEATWSETIATLLVTAAALLFVTFLAVVIGLA